MFLANTWEDYEVLDTGDGEKLERWGNVILRRPDPQTIWPKADPALWKQAQAHYHRSEKGGGEWEFLTRLPERWTIQHQDLRFYVRPTGFKHTGLFPEQAANWVWMADHLPLAPQGSTPPVVTGRQSSCASMMPPWRLLTHFSHVDAAKGMIQWGKENRELSKLPEERSRWIVEDALRFVQREIRRGNTYDGILMDPPSYGRGPSGEVWKLENELFGLVDTSAKVLSDKPLFFLINSYTTGFQASVLSNMLLKCVSSRHGGIIDAQELCLPVTTGGVLPCGASGRWSAE